MSLVSTFRPQSMSEEKYESLCQAVIAAAREMTPAQVADLADSLYDIRRTKRRRVDLHQMIDELR